MELLAFLALALALLAFGLRPRGVRPTGLPEPSEPVREEEREGPVVRLGRTASAVAVRPAAPPQTSTPLQLPSEPEFRPDADAFAAWLATHRIRALYHFTDLANVPSIVAQGGLLSWAACERAGIAIARPGGNSRSRDLDRQGGHEDYVRVSFCAKHPMMFVAKTEGRILQPVVLRIDPAVLLWQGTLVADRNATDGGASIGGSLEDLQALDPRLFRPGVNYNHLRPEAKKAYQAEVLVPTFLPARLILNWEEVGRWARPDERRGRRVRL